jgi:uncharacterized membrane protein
MPKQVPFTEVSTSNPLDASPPDGKYAVISYDSSPRHTRYHFSVENPFPWSVTIYVFKDGLCDEVASGSSPEHELTRRELDRVFLVGLSAELRSQLDQKLARSGIELTPA